MLQYFDVTKFIASDCGRKISFLWKEFLNLYQFLRKDSFTDPDIDSFKINVKNWIKLFCKPTIGKSNFINQKRDKGLNIRQFSTSSIEKKNHLHVKLFFGGTIMGEKIAIAIILFYMICYLLKIDCYII
ncbi:hypothetical protein RhiirA4_481824 [Rhizophagus irregularis]|uniref:Uncharacterized protein n=1 Tax=Rhizophagus irregularis TaxID=588596 RepID=A0A2I1HK35_9GLOM|nr:hypothetical protein RhiirA4_481824 [Rhizophagus irregularis]